MHSNDLRPRPEKQVVAVFRAVPPNAQVFGVISETVFLFRHQSILHMIPLNLSERPLLLIKSWGMVIAVVLGLASQPLLAQQSAVYDQLVKISELMIDQGYSKSHDFEVDYLNEDATDEYNITLQKGVTYKIIAVCDNDCEDIDLCMWDENDNQIDCDEAEDDVPILEVTPRWTGTFSFRVTMYDCGSEPCYFGIGVFKER